MNPGDGVATAAAGTPGAPAPEEAREERLPLRELDRALAPVRRAARSALDRGHASPWLAGLLAPHAAAAAALPLPGALHDALVELAALVAALPATDAAPALSDVLARIARIDALAGLPLPFHPRPVAKVRQVDVPEPAEAPAAPPGRPQRAEPAPAAPAPPAVPAAAPATTPAEALDEDEDDGEFDGDLSASLADVAPAELQHLVAPLAALEFETVRDLTWCRPSRLERLAPIHGAGRELPAGRVAVGGRVGAAHLVLLPGGGVERGFLLHGAGPLRVRWAVDAGAPPARGAKVVLAGTVDPASPGALQDAELTEPDGPVVNLPSWDLPGVSDRALRQLHRALAPGYAQVRDPLPAEALKRHGLAALGDALVAAHVTGAERGARRLAFDEALLAQLAPVFVRTAREGAGGDRGVGHTLLHGLAGRLGQTQELVLDDGAQAILEDLKRDLRRNVPSKRVVTSEVGGGKGGLALVAAVMVAESKNQVLIVGADAADAEQRFLLAEPLLKEAGLVGRLLPASPTASAKDALRRGEVQIAFAPPELFDEGILATGGDERAAGVPFRRLGLVIAFERDRFGVAAAAFARLSSPRPHLLTIPLVPVGVRALTTAYADHQVSLRVDPLRRPAKIALCGADERLQAYVRLRDVVDAGDQGVVVFPTVDNADALDIPDVLRMVRALENDTLKGVRVALLHGAMPAHERSRLVDDLLHRRVSVLVSTARVEDLPRVPGVAMVVVEQADRMEQWRLHRVIGWLSRSAKQATALLVVGENAEPESAARIDRVVSAPDGASLTEALIRLRGVERSVAPGAAPMPSWRWVDPDRHLEIVLAARDEAHRLLRADPSLRRGSPSELSTWLRRRWAQLWPGLADAWPCPVRDDGPGEPRKKRRRRRRKR